MNMPTPRGTVQCVGGNRRQLQSTDALYKLIAFLKANATYIYLLSKASEIASERDDGRRNALWMNEIDLEKNRRDVPIDESARTLRKFDSAITAYWRQYESRLGAVLEEIVFIIFSARGDLTFDEPDILVDGTSIGASRIDVITVRHASAGLWDKHTISWMLVECKHNAYSYFRSTSKESQRKLKYMCGIRQHVPSPRTDINVASLKDTHDLGAILSSSCGADSIHIIDPSTIFAEWTQKFPQGPSQRRRRR